MSNLWQLLNGKKTFILCILAAVVFLLQLLGVLSVTVAEQLFVVLGFGSAAALRAGMKRP